MSMTALPLELLLDIMELLLAERGKVSYRAAAGLAQACRNLRTSPTGKRARYFYALASLSMPVPSSLPADIDYETEVLAMSRWPHEDPYDDPDESGQVFQLGARSYQQGVISGDGGSAEEDAKLKADAEAMETASEVFLRGDTVIALDATRKKLLVGVAGALPMSDRVRWELHDRFDWSLPSPYSWASIEAVRLSKMIQLDSTVTKMAVDSDEGKVCALVYAEPEDQGKLIVEMRLIESGDLLARYYSFESIEDIALMGDYIRLKARNGQMEVRRWKERAPEDLTPDCPIVWRSGYEPPYFVSLLAPHFMAISSVESWGVEFHRLDQPTGSTLVAGLDLAGRFYEEGINCLKCGGKIAPGEEGLVVIQLDGNVWLLELSVLVQMLCFGPSESDRDLGVSQDKQGRAYYWKEWITKHMYRFLPIRREFAWWIPAVSGWKCAFLFGPSKQPFQSDLSYIKFLDMSTTRQLGCGSAEQSPARCFKWKDRHFFTWDSPIEYYLPASVKQARSSDARVELYGPRLLLYNSPESHGMAKQPCMRLWRT